MLGYIKHVLKADAVGIVWNFYTPSPYYDPVGATGATLSARKVGILTQIAERDGLAVEYRPLILVSGADDPWEGQISPYPEKGWFSNYYRAELPYLQVAQRFHVSEFVTATELTGLNRSRSGRHSSRKFPRSTTASSPTRPGMATTSGTPGRRQPRFPGGQAGTPASEIPGHGHVLAHEPPGRRHAGAGHGVMGRPLQQGARAVLRRTAIDETGIQARAGAYLNPGTWRLRAARTSGCRRTGSPPPAPWSPNTTCAGCSSGRST